MIITSILTMLGVLFIVIIGWSFLSGVVGVMSDGQVGDDAVRDADRNITFGVMGFLVVVAIGVLRGFGVLP